MVFDVRQVFAVADSAAKAVLAEAVVYTAPGGSPESIRAHYRAAHELVGQDESGAEVTTTAPTIEVVVTDLDAPPVQDAAVSITRTGETFRVDDVQPRASGTRALLVLVT